MRGERELPPATWILVIQYRLSSRPDRRPDRMSQRRFHNCKYIDNVLAIDPIRDLVASIARG